MRKLLTTVLSLLLMVCSLGQVRALGGVQGQPAAFTPDSDMVGAFVVSDSGRLYRIVLDLNSQNAVWEDLGGTQLRPSVSAVNAQLAFVLGGDGNLYAKYWDGNAWQWSYQGNPGVTLSGNMSAISYRNNDGTENVAVFVVGDDNSLYVNWWNGQVYPQGGTAWYLLGGIGLTHYVSAVTYYDQNNNLQIKTYIVGGDGNLYVKYWDGSAWQWQFIGRPDVNVSVALPSATLDSHNHDPVIDGAFVVGSNGHLYAWSTDSGWGDGGGSQLSNPPAALQSFGLGGSAYIVGGNGVLYAKPSPIDIVDPNLWYSAGGCLLKPFLSATLVHRHDGNSKYDDPFVIVIGGNGLLYALEGMYVEPSCEWYGYDLSAYPNAP
jgi:hypothetical protein